MNQFDPIAFLVPNIIGSLAGWSPLLYYPSPILQLCSKRAVIHVMLAKDLTERHACFKSWVGSFVRLHMRLNISAVTV